MKVSIAGASGYAGGDLLRILHFHPEVEIQQVTSERHAGKPVSNVHPNLRKVSKLKFCTADELTPCDVLFASLPHGYAMQRVDKLASLANRIIDLSADFRLDSAEAYAKWYGQEHGAIGWLDQFV